jgi:predicted ferric reductase
MKTSIQVQYDSRVTSAPSTQPELLKQNRPMKRPVALLAALLYVGLLILPVSLSFLAPEARSLEPRPILNDLASGLAMVGFAAVLMEFFLLGRIRPMSTIVGSDFLMQSHQLFARTAGVFIVLHPFFYSVLGTPPKADDPTFAESTSLTGASLFSGILGMLLLLAIIFSALNRNAPESHYERWRKWHAIMAVGVAATGLHHVLDGGRYAQLTSVQVYWWLLFSLAIASLGMVYVIRPLLQARAPFRVKEISNVALKTWKLVLEPFNNHRFKFKPGQFAWLKLGSARRHADNPFSISSAPAPRGEVTFLIKEVGDFTSALPKTPIGAPAFLDGPHGHFEIPEKAESIVMIAGGIGIAPFVGLLQEMVARADPRPVRVITGNRLAEQAIVISSMVETTALKDFKEIPVLGEPRPGWLGVKGQLDYTTLKKILEDETVAPLCANACFMVCGPAPMIDATEAALVTLGVPLERIISEKFQYDFTWSNPRSRKTLAVWLAISAGFIFAILALRFLA